MGQTAVQHSMDLDDRVNTNVGCQQVVVKCLDMVWPEILELRSAKIWKNILPGQIFVMRPGGVPLGELCNDQPIFEMLPQCDRRASVGETMIDLAASLADPVQAFPLGVEGFRNAMSFVGDLSAPTAARQLIYSTFIVRPFSCHFLTPLSL